MEVVATWSETSHANLEPASERSILEGHWSCAPPSERQAYLDGACGEDAAHAGRGGIPAGSQRSGRQFPGVPAPLPGRYRRLATVSEGPFAVIGPYKLLEQIGEGGMGTVYLAEQRQPVSRMVALKVIKPGMDSRQVLARFEAERQALALMDHPNIAKVLDGGCHGHGSAVFRDGTRQGPADHRVLRRAPG